MTKSPATLALASAFSLSLVSLAAMAQGGAQSSQPPGSSGQDSFLQLDRDMDGKVTQEEASQSQMLKDRFSEADSNQDGSVDASEFSAFVATSGGQQQQSAGQSFQSLDKNQDGSLDQSEAQVHPTLSQQYSSADQDQDGSISQSEFSAFESGQGQAASGGQSFQSLDKNRDGTLDQNEAQAHPTLSQQYSSADKDQDGSISQSEFSAFESQQGQQATGGQQAATGGQAVPFEQIDANRDGWISRQEYQSYTSGGQSGQVSFQSLDTNRDGGISQDEANAAPMLSQQFPQYDQDQNGYIDQSEFSAFESAQQGGGSQ